MANASGEGPYRSYIENAPIGVFVVDTEGAYVDVNAAGCELSGYGRAELLSMSVSDLTLDGALRDAFHELRATGRVQTETQLLRSDGQVVPISLDAVALDGDRFLAYCQDISERRTYEQRLEESEARYRSMATALDTSSVGTFVLDSDFCVVWASEAIERFFDVQRDDIVGADKVDRIHADIKHVFAEPDRFAEVVTASYDDNSYVESFACHVTPGERREERWLLHWSTPIESGLYAGGRIEHYTDVTERVRYERSLEEQRDNLRVVNEVMRHDIRNDLQLILANAEFLSDHVDAAGRPHVETILASAEEAVSLTRTARETADMMLATEGEHSAVGLRSVLEGELDTVRETNADVVLTVETTIPPVAVRADDMLASVFRNLLQNAVQHNDSDVPEVRVAVMERPGIVAVRVVDNGLGIDDDRKETIFGKDEKRLDSPGTGLGLYLVRTLVERYGGRTWVEDRQDGENGAVFVVELPKAEL